MYLPKFLAPFKREGDQLHRRELKLFSQMIDNVRSEIKGGSQKESFVRTWLENRSQYELTDDEAAYVIGTLFEAGAGTTAAALMSFVLAMVQHPDWQRKLHTEIDKVVGDYRLPTFDDIPHLPTVRAIIKETLRWRPVTAGGFPHQLIRDDTYDGYSLPAGSNIHPNQWAIHRDPSLYPDADSFRPDRWLEPAWPTYRAPLTEFPRIQNFSSFGFGRRICPGQNIAERSLNILVARIAWACQIGKQDGVEAPLYDYTSGFNVQPKPFSFSLTSRSPYKERLLEEKWKNDAAVRVQ
jgi:cytochrome P450